MNSAIIALGQTGADVLTQFHGICAQHFNGVLPVAPFYLQTDSKEPASLPFVAQSFPLSVQSLAQVDAEIAQIFKSYGQPDTALMNGSRRVHALRFQYNKQAFYQAFDAFLRDAQKPIVYVYARADDIAASPILTSILRDFAQRIAFIYPCLFYPDDCHDIEAASLFATLSEIENIPNLAVQHLSYKNPENYKSYISKCALQVFQAACSLHPLSGFPLKDNHPAHRVMQTNEMSVIIDRKNIQHDLARHMAAHVMIGLLCDEPDETDTRLPMWMDQLFEDKRWLMHPDFLLRDQEYEGSQRHYGLLRSEWENRARIFQATLKKNTPYQEQVSGLMYALEEIYRHSFRETGVVNFYALHQKNIDRFANYIVTNIEISMVQLWMEEKASFSRLDAIFNEIIRTVEDTLNINYHGGLPRQQKAADDRRFEYNQLKKQVEEGNKKELSALAQELPFDKAQRMMCDYFIADCRVKASNYAIQVLNTVISCLRDLQERFKNLPKVIEEQTAGWIKKENEVNIEKLIDHPFHHVYALSGLDAKTISSILPKCSNLRQVRDEIWRKAMDDAGYAARLDTVIQHWALDKTAEELSRVISSNCPLLRPEYDLMVLWRLMNSALIHQTAKITHNLHGVVHQKDNGNGVWLLPMVPPEININNFAAALRGVLPGAQMLVNVSMSMPMIIYRENDGRDTNELSHFEQWQNAYETWIINNPHGAVHSMLLHAHSKMPFPDSPFHHNVAPPAPDKIREYLLRGELLGLVGMAQNKNHDCMLALRMPGNDALVIAPDFQAALAQISVGRFELLRRGVDAQKLDKPFKEVRNILDARLENIKEICLNGKTDLKKASWEEAGKYMPWARVADKIITKVKKEQSQQQAA